MDNFLMFDQFLAVTILYIKRETRNIWKQIGRIACRAFVTSTIEAFQESHVHVSLDI